MSNIELLNRYIPLVDFLGEVCGKNFEIILHDITNPGQSVIAIKNGHLSGRKVGDPMTDLAMKVMHDCEHTKKNFITNYEGRTKDNKVFVSSTYFIKEGNLLIGMMCINHDTHDILEIKKHLSSIMESFSLLPGSETPAYHETLDSTIGDLSNTIIYNTISQLKVDPARMRTNEKIDIIRSLDSQGVFSTKGSIPQVANALRISEPTVYRYLNASRK